MLSGIVAFTFAILANSSPCESTAMSFFDASSATGGVAACVLSSARGTMQAMAATPTPPAMRKPLPSPAAAVERCRAARRDADAKRENILCTDPGRSRWRGQLGFAEHGHAPNEPRTEDVY